MKLLKLILLLSVIPFITISAQQKHSDTFDDVVQYVPLATTFVMKAAGVENGRNWWETVGTAAASFVLTEAITYGLKHTVKEKRPDHSDHYSFSSGHAAVSFCGATVLHKEYGHISPWITVGGYTVATLTCIDRVRHDRHHWYDVAAGAAIGFASTELTYYISDKILGKRDLSVGFTGNTLSLRWTLND